MGENALPIIRDRDMLYVLLEELRTLPQRYQTPLVMRYIEGESRRAIAEQTDSTIGQIQGRLARGRRLLRSRLVRRGVSLSIAAGAMATTAAGAEAAVSPLLAATTAKTCLAFNASGAASGLSPAALELAKEGVKAMSYASITKFPTVATLLVAAGIVWAAQPGEGSARSGGTTAPARLDLQTAVAENTGAQEPAPATIAAAESGHEKPDQRDAFLASRLKYRVPFEIGSTETKEGGRIEIEEILGTRPRIEVGGQYLVRGKYKLPAGQRGTLYFYETATGNWGREPTANMDLQQITLDKPSGEFTLLHGMQGPGYFHLYLASPVKYSHYFANVYFGTGDNVLRKKDSTATTGATGVEMKRPGADKASSSQPAKSAEEQRDANKRQLEQPYGDLLAEMAQRLDEKANESAELERLQLQKSLLQRELEHLHAMLVEIDLPAVPPSDDKTAKDKGQNRLQLRDEIARKIAVTSNDFAKQTEKTAKLLAELERLQLAVVRIQTRLDELGRRSIEMGFPQEQSPAATASTNQPHERLAAGDAIRVRVTNAFASQPINDVYHVESMGTVALGPSYGRVKVAGLSILEAEEAVKKHLAQIIENPEVQVSEVPMSLLDESQSEYPTIKRAPPTARASNYRPRDVTYAPTPVEEKQVQIIQQLQQERTALEKENAELKKKLEQREPAAESPPIGPSSSQLPR